MPRQHLTGFQRVPIENPFRYRSIAVGGFLEDGTSLPEANESHENKGKAEGGCVKDDDRLTRALALRAPVDTI